MKIFNTDLEKIDFLLEADADLWLASLAADGKLEAVTDLPAATEAAQAGELPPDKRPKYITNFIGSKQKLVDWIWANTPEDVKTVFDAFSGSSAVGYMYKTKGLRVISNDCLEYCHHIARAIIENNDVRLSENEIEALLKEKNPKAGDYIQKNFRGIFFKDGVLALLDNLRANVDVLSGVKKSIALFALGKTCVSGGGFGHFNTTTTEGKRHYTPTTFLEYYKRNLHRVNALVFDNGKENKAHHGDIMDVAPGVKADLAYFDPPYATQFSTTHYEKAYHFVEGLMTYWRGKEIDRSKKVRSYQIDSEGVTPANAKQFFTDFLNASKHISHWLISYRDKAHPTENEIKKLVSGAGRDVRMKSRDHDYKITKVHGEASHAKERLFICGPPGRRSATADVDDVWRLCAEALESLALWEETKSEIRYRVRDPRHFIPETFRRKEFEGIESVSIVIARLKKEYLEEGDDPESMVVQAYRFRRKNDDGETLWTMDKAKKWISEHEKKEAAAEDGLFALSNMVELGDLSLEGEFDPDILSAIAGKTDNVLVTGFIGNKHFIMNWIDRHFPKDAKSLFDAFSGGANVAYFYKRKGLRVICNDIMRYSYHIARAVIENNTETISDEELEKLLEKNPGAGSFITDTFYGYYYTKPILEFLDNTWANIQKLKGYKKDIALAALGHTCKAKAVFGMFNRSKRNRTRNVSDLAEGYRKSSIGNVTLKDFTNTFKKYVRQINGLVYDNGQENKAYNDDVLRVIPKVKADVIYCDPPYITEFLRNDYEDYYHFVEGLMSRWQDRKILDTPRRNFSSRTHYDKESIRALIEKTIDAASRNFPRILISYRDKAYPSEKELREILGTAYGGVTVRKIAVEYNIVKRESAAGGKYANELLFIGNRAKTGSSRAGLNEKDLIETTGDDFRMKTRKNSQLTLGHSLLHRWFAAGWDSEGKNSTTTWSKAQVVSEHTRLHRIALDRGLVFSFMPGTIDETLPDALKKQVEKKIEENKASASAARSNGTNHASIIGDISIVRNEAFSTEGLQLSDDAEGGDKEFTFILTHAGTNKNGDHFTIEELEARHQTAVNKKIDLKHSQDFTDIVGGIVASDFVLENESSWVECVGELYTNDNVNARLAYKLMKKGIITQVSMECDYEEGECSICGKRVKSKAEYCIHLKKFKGGEFKGKPVYEILHGIVFTGLGLLDRKGADENAKIKQVASSDTGANTSSKGGSKRMEDETRNNENTENEAANEKLAAKIEELEKRIKELESENRDLKSRLDETTKKYEKVKADQEATERRTRAEKFVKSLEEKGLTFTDEEDREAELKRLAGLSDEAFKATEDAYSRVEFPSKTGQDGAQGGGQNSAGANRNRGGSIRSNGDVRPFDVDDNKKSLEDKLKSGFMAAYEDRRSSSS